MKSASQSLSIAHAMLASDDELQYDATPFFEHIRLANGVYRTTAPHRLDDINAAVLPHIAAYAAPRILDVGSSSGISSAELSRALFDAGIAHSIYVSDLVLWAVATQRMGLAFLYETGSSPHLLQVDICNTAFPNVSGSRWRNTVYRLVNWIAPHRFLIEQGRRVMLVGPALRCHAQQNGNIHFLEFDVLRPPMRPIGMPYQVIRAANILNRGYFSDETLALAISNLFSLLDEGGLFIVARTHPDGTNHASGYVRESSRMCRVVTINSGSECDSLVEAFSQLRS